MMSFQKPMRILTVLVALTAGPAAFASAPAAGEASSPGQTAETKQAAPPKTSAPKDQGHTAHGGCVCVGLQAPLVPDYGG